MTNRLRYGISVVFFLLILFSSSPFFESIILAADKMKSFQVPAVETLTVKRQATFFQISAQSDKKVLARVYTEGPAKEPKFNLTLEKEAILLDTTPLKGLTGYGKTIINILGLDPKAMADANYCLYVELQGQKGGSVNLYFEGRTGEGQHYYKMLDVRTNGLRQKFSFEQVIPEDLLELHLRFDFLTPGEYRLFGAEVKLEEEENPEVWKKIEPELLFHLSFDKSDTATFAAGEAKPIQSKNMVYQPGIKGDAADFSRKTNSVLEYALSGNLLPERGSISVWVKPDWTTQPDEKTDPATLWRTILSLPWKSDGIRQGSGAIWFWIHETLLRGDTSDLKDRYICAPAPKDTGWHHFVFTWNKYGKALYIDGNSFKRLSDDSSRTLPARAERFSRFDFQSFFVGNYQYRPFQGLLDELRIYSAPLSQDEVVKLYREFKTTTIKSENLYFMDDEKQVPAFTIGNNATSEKSFRVRILDEKKVEKGRFDNLKVPARSSSVHRIETALAPGIYNVVLDEMSGENDLYSYSILVFDSKKFRPAFSKRPSEPTKLWTGDLELRPIETIDPIALRSDPSRFTSIGDLTVSELDGQKYLETAGKPGQRFAIRLKGLKPNGHYCFEYDIPDNTQRTVDIIAQSTGGKNGSEYELQVGCVTGDEYPVTNKIITQRYLYWSKSDDVTLVFMSARNAQGGAALAKLRVFEVVGDLPKANIFPSRSDRNGARSVGIYFEDPAINYDFGIDGGQIPTFEPMLERLCNYMEYSGQNLLAYPIVWYQGIIGEKYQPRPHVPDFLEAYLTVFDRKNFEFMPTINQNNVDFELPTITRQGIKQGAYYDTPFTIHNTGTPHPGGWHGTPPNFNPLHPDVQKMTLRYFDEILKVGVRHRSFKGIIMHLPRHALHSLGDIRAGYNDYLVLQFMKETGTVIPVDQKDPRRGKLWYDWLMKNAREKWIDWRCKKLADWYKELAEKLRKARPDLKLCINCMTPILYEESHFDKNDQKDFWGAVNREAGIDAKYFEGVPNLYIEQTVFPADYRWTADRKSESIRERLRNTETRAGMYESLAPSKNAWIHMHDRYWESAIGNVQREGRGIVLPADWLKEHLWRVTTLNPVGYSAMKHYIMPLRYKDVLAFSKGGFLIGTYGMENELVRFSAAFRALPAVAFDDVSGSTETVKVRSNTQRRLGWFYAVNTSEKIVDVTLNLNTSTVLDLAQNIKVPVENGSVTVRLQPYELRSFAVSGVRGLQVKSVVEK